MLKIVSETTEVSEASVPIRWCINGKTLEVLKSKNARNPQILLVTKRKEGRNNDDENRYLVPLGNMVQYVSFRHPGENIVLATIVWDKKGDIRELKDEYLRKASDSTYQRDIVNFKNKFFRDVDEMLGMAGLKFDVPKELFAKEPNKWERRWVNLIFKYPPRDQCEYRRRRIFAYGLQLPAFIVGLPAFLATMTMIMIFRLMCVITLLALGQWDANLKPLLHPLANSTSDIWYDVWFRDNKYRKLLLWMIKKTKPSDEKMERIEQTKLEMTLEEYRRRLSCENIDDPIGKMLPIDKKIQLKLLYLKTKVCKPFSG